MSESPPYIRHYKRGMELYDGGHYEEALVSFKKSLVCKPDFPDIYLLIARIYAERKHYVDAISMYEKVVKYLPNDLEALYEYGRTLLLSGEDNKGIKTLNRCLSLNPADTRARTELIRYYNRTGVPKKALSTAEAGIKHNPYHAPFYAMAGDALRKLNKFQKAQDYYDKCLEIDSSYEPAKRGINATVRSMEEGSDTSHARQPKNDAREEMIVAAGLYAEQDYDEAIVRLLDLKNRSGVEREATMLLGLAFARKGLYKRAHDVFLEYIKEHPPDIQVLYNLGLALNRMGRYDEAITYLEEALTHDDEYFEALLELGYAHLLSKQIAQARDYLFKTIKVDKEDARPYVYLAKLAYDRNDRKKVAEFFKKAMGYDKSCAELNYIRGYIAIHEGKPGEAKDYLEAFLNYAQDHFDALKLLGKALGEMHDFNSAVEAYRQAASLNPRDEECQHFINKFGD